MIRDYTTNKIITLTTEGHRYVNNNTKKEFNYMITDMLKK